MQARPFQAAAPGEENAEGEKTSREALLVGERQRLGAWAASEEEPEAHERIPGTFIDSTGAWSAKTLKPNPSVVKGMRGVPKQCRH